MKRPLVGIALAFATGIAIGSWWNFPVGLVAAGALLALAGYRWRFPVYLAVALAGAAWYRAMVGALPPDDITRWISADPQNVYLRGVVATEVEESNPRQAESETDRYKFTLAIRSARLPQDDWSMGTGRVLVYAQEAGRDLEYGDEVECYALLKVPRRATNPGEFDWRRWLAGKGIQRVAIVRRPDDLTKLSAGKGNALIAMSLRLRKHCEAALHAGLEAEPKLAGVLAGMVIGERASIPVESRDDFQQTGVFHVFAISGLHVGMVTMVVLLALRLVRLPRHWAAAVAIPVLVLYVFATGARPGAVRALVMASVWLVGVALKRPVDLLNSLGAAALIILVAAPAQLFDGGFVLSFVVVAALVLLTRRVQERLAPWAAGEALLPDPLKSKLRLWGEEKARQFVGLLSGSIAAWVGTLPLMAVYFHLFTPVSILANVLVVPMVGVNIAIGFVSMLVYAVAPGWAEVFNNANFALLSVMIGAIEGLAKIPGGFWFVRTPALWMVWAYYGALVVMLGNWHWLPRRHWVGGIALVGLLCCVAFDGRVNPRVDLTVLDLGDGAALFIDAPGESNDLLVDAGGPNGGSRVVVPFLRSQGVDRLAATMLTCADRAHAGGLVAVQEKIPVREALSTGMSSRSKYHTQWLVATRAAKIPLRSVRAGATLSLPAGGTVRGLYPPDNLDMDRSEDKALVLMVEFAGHRVLCMSDAGETVERNLLASGQDLRADVLVRGRHGKELSCLPEFLAAVQPGTVVLQVSPQPSHRYPQPAVLGRLEKHGVKVLRTDVAGAVRLRLTKSGVEIGEAR